MIYRINYPTILFIITQFFLLQNLHAETPHASSAENSQVITPLENTHQVAASSGDAIQQFVHAGFSERRTMLNQWPASIEELDRLVAYVDNNELYTDGSGHTYILKNDEKLFSYPDEQVVETWPADLSQVTLVNTLRKALSFGQAKVRLQSEDASQRLEAIDILENNLTE